MAGSTLKLPAPFKNAQRMSRGAKGCPPECVHSDSISGCVKEKLLGFTQGRWYLAILCAFYNERTRLLERGSALFYLEVRKAFSILPILCPD